LVDKNADGPFFTGRHRPVSTICLGSILKPSACFALLRICWLQRNLQRTWDRYCNRKVHPCQGSMSSHFSYLVYWVLSDPLFRARPGCFMRNEG
jgi:hypothetical protein